MCVRVYISADAFVCFAAYCPGGIANQVISSSNVSQILNELSEAFCGCQTVDSSIDITFPVEDNTSLVENDFNFLYYLKEITGFLRISNLPSTPRFHLPNLILIRGREQTDSGNSLEISDSRVDSIFFPNLREINGNVSIHNSSWCGYTSVNWEDILENGRLVVSGNDTTCIRHSEGTHTHTHTHTHKHTQTHTQTSTHTNTHVRTHVGAHTCTNLLSMY